MSVKPLISVQLDEETTREFDDIASVESWYNKENENWEWLRQVGQPVAGKIVGPWDGQRNPIGNHINELKNLLKNDSAKDDQINAAKTNLTQTIEKAYLRGTPRLIDSNSAEARFVRQVRQIKSDHAAAFCLGWFGGFEISGEPESIRGAFLALQYEQGTAGNLDAERKEVKALWSELDSVLGSWRRITKEYDKRAAWLFEGANGQIENQADEFTELLKNSKQELGQIEDVYSKKLALQSSVAYWTTKETKHLELAKTWGIAAAATAGCVVLVIGLLVYFVLGETTVDKLQAWQVTTSAVILTFGVWGVRTLVKIFMSHTHSAEDANERVTMIQTYLAMLRDDGSVTPEDRGVILDSLFRPGHFGLIKEDGPGTFEWLNRER